MYRNPACGGEESLRDLNKDDELASVDVNEIPVLVLTLGKILQLSAEIKNALEGRTDSGRKSA